MTDHLTARYGLIHGAYWASYAAIAAYVNLYLLEMGFSSGAIGVLIALAGLLSALLQPLAASYADRETSPNLKTINLAIAALWMLSALGLLVSTKIRLPPFCSTAAAFPCCNCRPLWSMAWGSPASIAAVSSTTVCPKASAP